ncbi:hypothetical protein [Robinsoniella peoriensis]|uniref:Uncharacterized protein n=1 Tax=Robinsoniella peoriensis TaxID=180332 RepID=A0A4U8QQS7_9FIRM|nr:hypothetical protein [Robinsoniella peoriensis]MDU7026973.1 hypothetical protein [Clostridiales bacterium]TLD02696.1 hypothetical protein DSM106044_00194 [Robinsoniella peoriensis]
MKKIIKKLIFIVIIILSVFGIWQLVKVAHDADNIFNRTRYVFNGKVLTINEIREKSYGFYGKNNMEDSTFAIKEGSITDKIFKQKVKGVNKIMEKQIITETTPFDQSDLSGGQAWVQKQCSILKPVFYEYTLYEYHEKAYIRMKFAVDYKRNSLSGMYEFEDVTAEQLKQLINSR